MTLTRLYFVTTITASNSITITVIIATVAVNNGNKQTDYVNRIFDML